MAEASAALIARHESLRTTCVTGDSRAAVAEALVQWLRESPDPGRSPVRMAVAIAPDTDDGVIACAARFTHLSVDDGAIEILKRDLADLLGDPGGRPADPATSRAR